VPQGTASPEDCEGSPHIRMNMVSGTVFTMRQSQVYSNGYQ